jgi:IS605 OrfB family transposase
MKLVAAVKLQPSKDQARALKETLERCNAACTELAARGFEAKVFRQFDLQKLAYANIRAKFELGAQPTVRCIAKVAHAFKVSRKKAPVFRKHAAQPYDDRILRFSKDFVSIWTLRGRTKIPFVCGDHQKAALAFRAGECDLRLTKGKWFLDVGVDVPETDEFKPDDWLGVDLGLVNIAVDSDHNFHFGDAVEKVRSKLSKQRASLQATRTKAAKRRLRKLSGKENRFRKHVNHEISKKLVLLAERTYRGLALEDLTHIRSRVTAPRKARARLSSWSFAQLRGFVTYKAKRAGVPVLFVDPAYTSQTCAECGFASRANRASQAIFSCVSCGHFAPADFNAARNIRARAVCNSADSSQAYAA